MWLSRTDVVPVLTIVAGGVVGVLLTLSPLVLMSPADDVSVPVQPTWSPADDVSRPARPVTARLVPTWSPDGQRVVFRSTDGRLHWVRSTGGEPQPLRILPDGQWIVYQSDLSLGGELAYVRMIDGQVATDRWVVSRQSIEEAPKGR